MITQEETQKIIEANNLDLNKDWETTHNNIIEYFETYVKSYYAFRDEPVYKAVMSFIVNYYVEQIYKVQIDSMQELYEKHVINQSLLDLLLVNIGLPEKLIKELSITTKKIIMKSFSDFERYKGTIKFFKTLGESLPDVISSYELYIDYWKECINPPERHMLIIDPANIENSSYFLISSPYKAYYVWFNIDGKGEDPKIPKKQGLEVSFSPVFTSKEIAQIIVTKLNITGEFFSTSNGSDVIDIRVANSGEVISPFNIGTTKLYHKIMTVGKKSGCWAFRPRPIYINPNTDPIITPLPYEDVVPKIPTWLVPEDIDPNSRPTDPDNISGDGGGISGDGNESSSPSGVVLPGTNATPDNRPTNPDDLSEILDPSTAPSYPSYPIEPSDTPLSPVWPNYPYGNPPYDDSNQSSSGGNGSGGGGTGGGGSGTGGGDAGNDNEEQNSPVVYPTKTNIVLLDYTQSVGASLFNLLIFTILMEDIGEDTLTLYMTGNTENSTLLTTTYNTMFLLWYYLLAKYYNTPLEGINIGYYNVMGTHKTSRFTPSDIPYLVQEYEKIDNSDKLYQFYFDNIAAEYNKLYKNKKPSVAQMESMLAKTDYTLYKYVFERFAASDNVEQEARYMMDEIAASVMLSFDSYSGVPNIYNYIHVLLEYLPSIAPNIKITDTYKLIYNLKPFHVELLLRSNSKIVINDKFNTMMFADATDMNFKAFIASMMRLADRVNFKIAPYESDTALSLGTAWFLMSKVVISEDHGTLDQAIKKFLYPTMSEYKAFTDYVEFHINYYEHTNENIMTEVSHDFIFGQNTGAPENALSIADSVIVGDPVSNE